LPPAAALASRDVAEVRFRVEVEEELAGVIDDYLRALYRDLRALVSALKEKDLKTTYKIGHDLKGSGAGYGLDRISEIGREICRLSMEKDLHGILAQIKELNTYLKNVDIVAGGGGSQTSVSPRS
jgi:hypothetical protein